MARPDAPAPTSEPAATAKILLDTPANHPGLQFEPMADALAKIIETSQPRFAVGIFGDWGRARRRSWMPSRATSPTTAR